MGVQSCAIPEQALLFQYAKGNGYADCYVAELAGAIDLAGYVAAFYTTFLFKIERALLALAARPSTDRQAKSLASGESAAFAAWRVEARTDDQLLMCDLSARTRSWFMIVPTRIGAQNATRLYFGSAVTAITNESTGRDSIGPLFQALMGFHKLYSRMLLRAASRKCGRLLGSEAKQ
ncbi:hypothetical protein [Nitratireductor rhodophyticola]|uniref:hypothetical protein n=1 Tax=Nitratireductor rhodophyticola TaxID=2854036 RepID=UPI00300A6B44